MACAGDIPTKETLAAVQILRRECPQLKIRVLNVVKLFALTEPSEHPHGLSDRDFDSLFTTDKPVIFNFHGYPVADSPPHLPPHQPPQLPRAWLQGEGQHQHAPGAGDEQPDRSLQPRDRCDRPCPRAGLTRRPREGTDEGRHPGQPRLCPPHGMDAPEITNWRWSLPVAT